MGIIQNRPKNGFTSFKILSFKPVREWNVVWKLISIKLWVGFKLTKKWDFLKTD